MIDFLTGKRIDGQSEPAAAVKPLSDVKPVPVSDQNADTVKPIAAKQAAARTDQKKAVLVYKLYQENIRKAGQRETEILKGLQRGENIAILFLQALEICGLYSGTMVTRDVAADYLQTVYGLALHDTAAAEMTAAAIRGRIDRMTAALATADGFGISRLTQAIKAHKDQLERLERG